jgi:hypothetical protein
VETSEVPSDSSTAQVDVPLAPPAVPFFTFDVRGHTIEFFDFENGDLVVTENMPSHDAQSVMVDLDPERAKLSDLYRALTGSETVPAEIAEYEARIEALALERAEGVHAHPEVVAPDGAPMASLLPGSRLTHEAGSAHFAASHCPTSPTSSDWDFYEEHAPITTRHFCWSGNHIGPWTETSSAKATSQVVAAVVGDVCYNITTGAGNTHSVTILAGRTKNVWARNGTFWDCCFICACGDKDILQQTMTASISTGAPGCNTPGLTWRWGGSYWR